MSLFRFAALLFLLAVSLAAQAATPFAQCIILRPDGVSVRFEVELAVTPSARQSGLMRRAALPARNGMWFDFERAGPVVMWMKDTLIPLDMAFIDERGELIGIHSQTVPLSLDHLSVPVPVRYVLEVNGGELAELGIAAGARVVLPLAE